MKDHIRELDERIRRAEESISYMEAKISDMSRTVHSLTTPLRIVDVDGNVVLEFNSDVDGGVIFINSHDGRTKLSIGCHPYGGFLDIIHSESGVLAVTLTATPEGGNIEVSDSNGRSIFDATEAGAVLTELTGENP